MRHGRRDELERLLAQPAQPAERGFVHGVLRRLRPRPVSGKRALGIAVLLCGLLLAGQTREFDRLLVALPLPLPTGLGPAPLFDFSLTGLVLLSLATLASLSLLLRD